MSIFDKIKSFNIINNSNKTLDFLKSLPDESKLISYVDTNLKSIKSDIDKYQILDYVCHNYPSNIDLYTKILHSINLKSKETMTQLISVCYEGSSMSYESWMTPISIIPLILNTTLYINNKDNKNDTEELTTVLINYFNKEKINLKTLPIIASEDAYYMSEGVFTDTGKEDPEIIHSSQFTVFKEKYEKMINIESVVKLKI